MAFLLRQKLEELNLFLPEPAKPAASYVPYVVSGKQVFISGQLPIKDGQMMYKGQVGKEISLEDAQRAAQLCGLNILAQLNEAVGHDMAKVVRCVKLGGFVNAGSGYEDHPKVINGASELMFQVLGEKGRHARFAVGASSLPFNVCVEIDAIFELV